MGSVPDSFVLCFCVFVMLNIVHVLLKQKSSLSPRWGSAGLPHQYFWSFSRDLTGVLLRKPPQIFAISVAD